MARIPEYWSQTPEDVLARLDSSPAGLEEAEAARRRETYRHLRLGTERRASSLLLFLHQFRSPTTLLLLGATLLSLALGATCSMPLSSSLSSASAACSGSTRSTVHPTRSRRR